MTRKDILMAAEECVCTSRQEEYGPVENNFKTIADLWSTYINAALDIDIVFDASDVALMMCLLKIARIATGKFKEDSYIDACGYMSCAGEIAGEIGLEGKE